MVVWVSWGVGVLGCLGGLGGGGLLCGVCAVWQGARWFVERWLSGLVVWLGLLLCGGGLGWVVGSGTLLGPEGTGAGRLVFSGVFCLVWLGGGLLRGRPGCCGCFLGVGAWGWCGGGCGLVVVRVLRTA